MTNSERATQLGNISDECLVLAPRQTMPLKICSLLAQHPRCFPNKHIFCSLMKKSRSKRQLEQKCISHSWWSCCRSQGTSAIESGMRMIFNRYLQSITHRHNTFLRRAMTLMLRFFFSSIADWARENCLCKLKLPLLTLNYRRYFKTVFMTLFSWKRVAASCDIQLSRSVLHESSQSNDHINEDIATTFSRPRDSIFTPDEMTFDGALLSSPHSLNLASLKRDKLRPPYSFSLSCRASCLTFDSLNAIR